jgi:membrane-bound metal-dependent hydrolase YbcI (DUF457 family)
MIFSCAVIATLPDFDFIPGWLIGQPSLFHRGASHSILMAIVVGLTAGFVVKITRRRNFLRVATIVFVLYALHIVLDLFGVDYSQPGGFKVLWPFSDGYYKSSHGIFMNIKHSSTMEGFFGSIFSKHNLKAVIYEFIIFLPPVLFLWGIRSRGKQVRRKH